MDIWLKVIILGIVEGITEFLPISSTGHLIVATQFLEFNTNLRGVFEIFIQIGAVVAVIAFYWSDLFHQVRTVRHDTQIQRFWLAIVIACVPAGVLGVLLGDIIDEVLFHPGVVALALIAGGIGFLVVERAPYFQALRTRSNESETTIEMITLRQALIVGIWQVLALIPGMSRSGMSIIGGMMVGLPRAVAAQFSFYLAIPVLGGATLITLLRNLSDISSQDLGYLIGGAVVSGIVAWMSIAWLLRYVQRNDFVIFGVYRIILGCLLLLLMTTSVL